MEQRKGIIFAQFIHLLDNKPTVIKRRALISTLKFINADHLGELSVENGNDLEFNGGFVCGDPSAHQLTHATIQAVSSRFCKYALK